MRADLLAGDDARPDISSETYVHFYVETGSGKRLCAAWERAAGPTSVQRYMCIFLWKQGRRETAVRCVQNARLALAGVVMNSGVERRAERLGDALALVLLDDEGRRQDEDVAEARHRRRVAADDDAGLRAAPDDRAARVII